MIVLGSWALLNIGSGIIGQGQTAAEQQHFYRMNTIWGGVNLLLAVSAIFPVKGSGGQPAGNFPKTSYNGKAVSIQYSIGSGLCCFWLVHPRTWQPVYRVKERIV
jgi:hypothetical protein